MGMSYFAVCGVRVSQASTPHGAEALERGSDTVGVAIPAPCVSVQVWDTREISPQPPEEQAVSKWFPSIGQPPSSF